MSSSAPISLDPENFQVIYTVKGVSSPDYKVYQESTKGTPFNTTRTPFLIPSDVERFGFNAFAKVGAAAAPVYWGVRMQFFDLGSQLITSHGFSGNQTVDHMDSNVDKPVQPNTEGRAGFTPIDRTGAWRDYAWQPADLPVGVPVRMSVTLLAYSDPQFANAVTTQPSDSTLSIWLMRP